MKNLLVIFCICLSSTSCFTQSAKSSANRLHYVMQEIEQVLCLQKIELGIFGYKCPEYYTGYLYIEGASLRLDKSPLSKNNILMSIYSGPEEFQCELIIENDIIVGLAPYYYHSESQRSTFKGASIYSNIITYYFDLLPYFLDEAERTLEHEKKALEVLKE